MTSTPERTTAILDEVERAVIGKRPALTLVLAAILAKGHVLLEDLPGLGKTLAARSLARSSMVTSSGDVVCSRTRV